MASVFDVARYILEKEGKLSTWKLQKLCYYSQAWTLAWGDGELFDEDFEAWSNGPVCPELFAAHKGLYYVTADKINGNPDELSDTQKENIDIILRDYGDKEAYWLREQTRNEEPWKDARGDKPEGAHCDTVIDKDSMGAYYGSL